jgi:hypothetical protein
MNENLEKDKICKTDGIASPTIREKEKVQIRPQPTAEPIPKHSRVMSPERMKEAKTAARFKKFATSQKLNLFLPNAGQTL